MIKVILISGKMGSGKSTLTQGLLTHLKSSTHYKFADPLYEMQEAIRLVADRYCIPFLKKEGRLLQLLGTEWGRKVKGDNVWVDAAIHEVSHAENNGTEYVIFDDCRFINEFNAFPTAFKVRLEAPASVRQPRTDAWREDQTHQSETDLDNYANCNKFDLVIHTHEKSKEETLELVLEKLRERQAA